MIKVVLWAIFIAVVFVIILRTAYEFGYMHSRFDTEKALNDWFFDNLSCSEDELIVYTEIRDRIKLNDKMNLL